MTAVGVIPARYEASRFPGKPLARIAGLPMIRRVWDGTRSAKSLRTVVVATDDERIAEVCRGFGAKVFMTRDDHPTGTDRIAEVALGLDDEIVVNVQGDEPLIEGFVIDAAVEALADAPEASMATVVHAAEDAQNGKWRPSKEDRLIRITKYEVGPLLDVRFLPAPPRSGRGKDFAWRTIPTGPNPYDVAAGDFDLDGVTDYAAACDGGLYVHFGGAEDRPVLQLGPERA